MLTSEGIKLDIQVKLHFHYEYKRGLSMHDVTHLDELRKRHGKFAEFFFLTRNSNFDHALHVSARAVKKKILLALCIVK